MNNKKGSSAVFLTVILAALMSITIALIYGVKSEASRSSIDAIVNLAGDSVLGEFDRRLYRDYGLFFIKGTDDELSEKLHRYINYSLEDMGAVDIESVKVTGSVYATADPSVIKSQIIEQTELLEVKGLIEKATGEGTKPNEESAARIVSDEAGRVLRHGPTIASLPSYLLPKKSLSASAEAIADKGSKVNEAFKAGTEGYLINKYITYYFNSKIHTVDDGHFFNNEVEYILGGETSDKKNEKRIEIALKAMRFPINMAYLYSDPKKQAALASAAQLMTPGPAAAATQAALTSTWAYAESDNDVELLWQGHKIPMAKDDSTWAIDLDTAIEGVFGGTVEPAVEKGYDYGQYLQILLFFQEENIKLARILDLIQINMRAEYDRDFLISECSTGIMVKVKANGRTYTYQKKY